MSLYTANTAANLKRVYAQTLAAAKAFGKSEADMVFGEGPCDASLMLIGEAPGAEETKLLRPFVGRAGKNLSAFLEALDLRRSDIYITNVIKFRPYRISRKGTLSNRPPARDEVSAMLPFLEREIEVIKPRIVVTLGNVPLKCLLGKQAVIGACHARPELATAGAHAFTLFPLYHPASVIYNRALEAVYAQDIEVLKDYLHTR